MVRLVRQESHVELDHWLFFFFHHGKTVLPPKCTQDHTRSLGLTFIVQCIALIWSVPRDKSCLLSFSTSTQSCGTESGDVSLWIVQQWFTVRACVQTKQRLLYFLLRHTKKILIWRRGSELSFFSPWPATRWLHCYTPLTRYVLTEAKPALSGESQRYSADWAEDACATCIINLRWL